MLGMLLWVRLIFSLLASSSSMHELRSDVNALPEGLEMLFVTQFCLQFLMEAMRQTTDMHPDTIRSSQTSVIGALRVSSPGFAERSSGSYSRILTPASGNVSCFWELVFTMVATRSVETIALSQQLWRYASPS